MGLLELESQTPRPGDPRAPSAESIARRPVLKPQPLGCEHSKKSRWAWRVFMAQDQRLNSGRWGTSLTTGKIYLTLFPTSFLRCSRPKAAQEKAHRDRQRQVTRLYPEAIT